ncbi:hypothetical protein BGW80DRAFT_1302171 [Lactifluus volemus]|nr:hypothetical protein BGW80DRAFT_1302171 [Lactifluus volemus]
MSGVPVIARSYHLLILPLVRLSQADCCFWCFHSRCVYLANSGRPSFHEYHIIILYNYTLHIHVSYYYGPG